VAAVGQRPLAFRPFEEGDFPRVQRLWRDVAGWGELERDVWEQRLNHPRYGAGLTYVAVSEGEVVGHVAFYPTRIRVDGRQVAAARLAAVIVARGFRSDVRDVENHTFWKMYRAALPELRARGFEVVYALPNPRWHETESSPFRRSAHPFWSLPLPLATEPSIPAGFEARHLEPNESLDALWERAAPRYPCAVVRDADTLRRRAAEGGYATAIDRDGALVAVVVTHERALDGWMSQWEIRDLVADGDDAVRAALAAALALGHAAALARGPRGEEPGRNRSIVKAAVLAAPMLQAPLAELGFAADDWTFAISVHALDPAIEDAVDPSRWYASSND
jgi:predicted N-acetyltransferase YhbS